MPSIAAHDFGDLVEQAVFLLGEPAFALADGTVRFPAGSERTLEVHQGGLLTARPDRHSPRLLTGGEDGRVVAIGGPDDWVELADIGKKWIDSVVGGPRGAVGFCAGRSTFVLGGEKSLKEVRLDRAAEDVAFAPKGMRAAVARYDGVSLFFPQTDAEPLFLEWKGAHLGIDFSPDGRFLVTTMQENALHGWRLSDGKNMRMTGYPAKVKGWSWSAKGHYLATTGASAAVLWPFQGKDGPMGKAPLELGTRGDTTVTAVACHPTEAMLAVGYGDGMILAVRFQDAREVVLRRGGADAVRVMNWDTAGRRLAYGAENGEAGVIDIAG